MLCSACKNTKSTDQCKNKPLKGLIFCGVHVKVKNPRLWKDANNLDHHATLIQKVWRGYSIRNWLNLSGPGVLNRSICHNEEELFSFEEKTSVHPLDYFSFKEGDKVYWFDVRTLGENGMSKLSPTNPYTREKLSFDTRQRLRKLMLMRSRRRLPVTHNIDRKLTFQQMLENTWIVICQFLEENGFDEVTPNHFLTLNRIQVFILLRMIQLDIISWASQHKKGSRRYCYVPSFKRISGEYLAGASQPELAYMLGRCLVMMLFDYQNPYDICFIIMSALYRV